MKAFVGEGQSRDGFLQGFLGAGYRQPHHGLANHVGNPENAGIDQRSVEFLAETFLGTLIPM